MAAQRANPKSFLGSFSAELESQASRVRDLIGDRHWLSDGHHKEYLLRALLQRHLPGAIQASRGFVLNPADPSDCSTEQDILVLDLLTQGPVLSQGDLAIAFPSIVLASVSVKTTYSKANLRETTAGLLGQRVFFQSAPLTIPWFGSFFFEGRDGEAAQKICDDVAAVVSDYSPFDDSWSGTEYCLRVGRNALARVLFRRDRVSVDSYAAFEDSTGVFVARLLDHLANSRGQERSDLADYVDEAVGCVDDHAHRDLAST